ncbi:unnamed protein product [Bathycoccus prasinos]
MLEYRSVNSEATSAYGVTTRKVPPALPNSQVGAMALSDTLVVVGLFFIPPLFTLNPKSQKKKIGNGKRVMRSPLEALSDSPRYSRNPEKVSSDKNFSPALFERTIAAQFEKALAKEFSDEDSALGKGVASEGAGRSFNQTISSRGGTLETVVRVNHEVRRHKTNSDEEQSTTDQGDTGGGGGAKKLSSQIFSPFKNVLGFTDKIKRMINAAKEEEGDVARLIDSSDNEFVISNPKSGTMELQQDLRLISDLVIVMCSATLGGIVFALLNQPLITGYLLSGSLIGPGGFGLIVELVQVETLAQLGVVFLLFALGIEFSPSKLRHVQGVALMGGLVIKCLMERNEMTSLSGQIAVVVRVYHKFLGSYCITVVNYSSQLQLLTA